MLEQWDIAHYLLSLGLVKPRAIVHDGLAVRDASRRHRVFLAAARDGPTFVIKQADPRATATLAHEAAVLRFLAGVPGLADHVPRVVLHDPGAGLLLLRTPGGGRDWAEHHGTGRFPRLPPRILGRLLGRLHRLPAGSVGAAPGVEPMWGLSLSEPPHELLLELSAGAEEVVVRLQASRAACARIDALREVVVAEALIHGDLRWDNCLALAAPGSRRRTRVLLVDWELAAGGAPGFDVGAVMAEYLCLWAGSIPIADARDPGRLAARAGHPLDAMRPAVQAFWSAYARASARPPALARTVELAAVRLLQIAVERAQWLTAASAHVVCLLQLADNMLRSPDEAARGLLGLRA